MMSLVLKEALSENFRKPGGTIWETKKEKMKAAVSKTKAAARAAMAVSKVAAKVVAAVSKAAKVSSSADHLSVA
ncbi:MAG TPA: hypothetical protein VJT71_18930 [Pyrinomonadaceae bacterium]|nr:hypothetical protein [Pyrinomonadaceae bacterium]